VNYHLRELERAQLVQLVGERKKGKLYERLMQATAPVLADRSNVRETWTLFRTRESNFSAVAGGRRRAERIAELAICVRGGHRRANAWRRWPLTAKFRFASPGARAAFAADMTEAFAKRGGKVSR